MYKKVMILGIGLLTLTGCNATELELMQIIEETTSYDAIEVDVDATIEISDGSSYLPAKIHISQEGYVVTESGDMQTNVSVTVDFTPILISEIELMKELSEHMQANGNLETAQYLNEEIDDLNLQLEKMEILAQTPIDFMMYTKGYNLYIKADAFEQIMLLMDEEISIEEDFIEFPLLEEYEEDTIENYNNVIKTYQELFFSEITLGDNLVKYGDEYIISLDKDDMIELGFQVLDSVMNNLEEVVTVLGIEELIEEEDFSYDEILTEYNTSKGELVSMIYSMEDMFDVNLDLIYSGKDGVLTEKAYGKLISDVGIGIDIHVESESKEADLREISFEGSSILFDDLVDLMDTTTYYEYEPEPFIGAVDAPLIGADVVGLILIDEEAYIPIFENIETFGYDISYRSADNETFINDKKVDTININGILYMSFMDFNNSL